MKKLVFLTFCISLFLSCNEKTHIKKAELELDRAHVGSITKNVEAKFAVFWDALEIYYQGDYYDFLLENNQKRMTEIEVDFDYEQDNDPITGAVSKMLYVGENDDVKVVVDILEWTVRIKRKKDGKIFYYYKE